MVLETIESRVARLTQKVSELEMRLQSERQRHDREIALVREQFDSGDVLCRRVEWTISDITAKLRELPKGHSIYSPEFSAGGVRNMQLEFFPNGRESATIEGMCSVFFWSGDNTRIKYQLFVGSHYRAPDDDTFTQKMGHGHSNFCILDPEVDRATDSVVVGVDLLEISKAYQLAPGLRVIRAPLAKAMEKEVAVSENRGVTRVEWRIKDVSRKLANAVRGSGLYSPLFSAAGVKEMQMEFYLKGNQSTSRDGNCAFYLRCPEGTRLVVSLAVGGYKRGPIAANFEGPAGKGIPDFCEVVPEIDRHNDTLLVWVEVKNVAEGQQDGKKNILFI